MPFLQAWFEVDFGSNYAGIGTTGYRLYQNDNTDSVARTTSGVVDLGAGGYGVPAVTVPDNAVGIEWDTGGGSPVYAREDIEPYRDRAAIDALALEANIEGHVTAALNTYDPPTRAEATADKDEILTDIAPKAIEANVEGHVTTSLNAYDPPTRAEATADKNEIITEIDENEVKLDTIIAGQAGQATAVDMAFLIKIIKNKKILLKTGSVWELIIYDNDDSTPILQKDLKDKDGLDITDLVAGTLAQELKTSV